MSDDFRELAFDLEKAAWKAIPAVAAVVAKGAHNIKTQMTEEAASSGHYKHFARSISYDLHRGGLEAEIGPDPSRTQGALDNILYFGTSKNAAVLDIEAAPREEAPRFEAALGEVAERLL